MGRMQLNPALRHRAHAPPSADVFTNAASVLCDGTDDFISTSTVAPDTLAPDAGFTVSFWFKVVSYINYDALFHLYPTGQAGNKDRMRIYFEHAGSNNYNIKVLIGDTNNAYAFTTILTSSPVFLDQGASSPHSGDGAWHHFAVATDPDANETELYLDGASAGTGTSKALSGTPNDIAVFVAHSTHSTYFVSSYFDEVALFTDRLPTTGAVSIATIYNGGNPGDLADLEGLSHWWRMGDINGSSGDTIPDQVGSLDLTFSPTGEAAYSADVAAS